MSKLFTFAISEFFLFAFAFGVILILYPGLPLAITFYGAVAVYLFATTISFLINLVVKSLVDKYLNKKETEQ